MRVNMSKFLWSYLLISPALLGATLVVSSSAMAADAQQAADALKPTAAKAETAETSEAKLNALAAVSETTAASEPVEEISKASAGNETQAAIADSGTAATESAIAGANTAPVAANPEVASQPTSESLAAAGPTVAQPVENSAPAAKLETPAPAATALPEQIGAVQLETPAPAVAESAAQSLPKPAEAVAQTAAPQDRNPAATLEQLNEYSSEGAASGETQGQVTSVSQLSDVRPTDWAFQALQSLVERYGCIAGYPDGTFRGNRAMTRYEFAAGLNACLDKVSEIIRASTSNLATKEDLAALQRLQDEFAAELATLRGRLDTLEARAASIETNQFSTTTKLSGEAIFSVADTTKNNNSDTQTVLNYRVRLNLLTSFTGKDTLITGLQAYNIRSFGPNLGLSTGAFSALSDSQAKLSFEPQFPGINPETLSSVDANTVELYKLLYVFPVSNSITLFAGPKAETSDAFQAITPFAGEGQEAVSRFAGYNPVVRVSGGTSGRGLASAGGVIWNISPRLNLTALYGSVNAALPVDLGFRATPLGAGAFEGSTVAAAPLTINPPPSIDIGLNYAYSRHKLNILATGLGDADLGSILGPDREPVSGGVRMNSFGGTLTWRFSPKIAVSTYGGWIIADAERSNASTTFNSWMVGFHFRDLFR